MAGEHPGYDALAERMEQHSQQAAPHEGLCPTCGTRSEVREHYAQATRTSPMRPLGQFGFCPKCDTYFKAE